MIKKKTCKRTVKRTTKRGKWSEEYKVKLSVKPVKRKKGNWSLFGLGKKKKVRGSGKGLVMAKNKSEAKKQFEKLGVTVTKVTKNRKGGYNVYHRV